ncbi:hypothetical protein N7451_011810 [Penicillium sp. IBT 35674x]|nr:hypothetical protein N7451_011810 [Penicillium sp. IBT 35674x]
MASSSSFTNRQFLPHLSQIIHLEPDKEPWCAGYAPSQGRRCHASTNAYGRRCAMSLLDEATEALHAGRCIDDLLDELAPHVLCRRWHQSQASDLTARWQKRILSYMRSHSSPRRESISLSARQPTRLSTRTGNREPTRAIDSDSSPTNVEEQCAELYQTLQNTLAELRRLQALQTSLPISSSTIETSTPRARDRGNAGTIREARTSNSFISSTETSQRATVATQTANPPRQAEVRARAPHREYSTQQLSSRVVPSTEERATSRDSHSSLRPAIQITRRDIEGPCGICLEALKSTELDDSDDSDEEYDSDSDSDEDYNEVNEEDSEQEEPRLVYCKAQCGNNFHESCLHEWLEHSTRPTCPMCRCAWQN